MDVIGQVYREVEARLAQQNPLIISIAGAADLGKSHIAQGLKRQLEHQGVSAAYLPLDSYLIPRDKRAELGLSGYDLAAYDFARITGDLDLYCRAIPFKLQAYNHQLGQTSGPVLEVKPSACLIIDGLHALADELNDLVDYAIFICTDDQQLRQIRHQADLVKRQLTREQSMKNLDIEMRKYRENVAPYQFKADLVLKLMDKWSYCEINDQRHSA